MLYRNGYDRTKHPEMIDARPMTAEEILNAPAGYRHEYEFEGRDGAIRRCRVSGALKTWKTRPGDFRLPVKYGMYESSAIVNRDGMAVIEGTGRPVLVRVSA